MDSLIRGPFTIPSCLQCRTVGLSAITNVSDFVGHHVPVQVSNRRSWTSLKAFNFEKLEGYPMNHYVRSIGLKSASYQKHGMKYVVNATSGHPVESEPEAYNSKDIWESIKTALNVFYRFSRPHTVIGTAMSIISVSLLAVKSWSDFSSLFFIGLLEAVVAALFMNVYIVGLNQLFDIAIDKVNKPYLPLASGEYSVKMGATIVLSFAIMSFWLGYVVGSWPLFWALFISFLLGTAYSINDIPDIDGDRIFGIQSFSVRLGQKRVFWICIYLLEMAYVVAVFVGAASSFLWSKLLTVLGHVILASILWSRAKSLDLSSKAAITSFYMFIWKLFYVEYLLIPLVR
ncbi:probable homogentisate phytyltransferase 1, chloroplastic isoform X4 [Macadamia integrifolia]|uniref:probable homogentisate phytyltransferase 1, chloroplastic isoform X4 n=1 Tax=Macadamia integrifolia TaxID=60698 RepID=UPI001C4FC851|nr:probable homogentisate phytyltransferase 1, chloroplastic isoform X4 [Macadamia integrifolia]